MSGRLDEFILADRWQFREIIGAGSDGTVYLARDHSTGQDVAIKVYDSLLGHGSEEIVRKVEAEAHIAHIVGSPSVVAVLAHGVASAAGGRQTAYLVMELLHGETVRAAMERYPRGMPEGLALEMMGQLLRAVDTLHRRRLVHFDLKPENLFLVDAARVARGEVPVKILDLTNARPAEPSQSGVVARGTPLYASPELCQRASGIGTASDVYSLGIVLYEMLTGRTPLQSGTAAQIVAQHVYGRLDDLPSRLKGTGIEQLYRRATWREPSQRFRDAGQMLQALDALPRTTSSRTTSPFAAVDARGPATLPRRPR
jgi:serine/threonine-protein kinase